MVAVMERFTTSILERESSLLARETYIWADVYEQAQIDESYITNRVSCLGCLSGITLILRVLFANIDITRAPHTALSRTGTSKWSVTLRQFSAPLTNTCGSQNITHMAACRYTSITSPRLDATRCYYCLTLSAGTSISSHGGHNIDLNAIRTV